MELGIQPVKTVLYLKDAGEAPAGVIQPLVPGRLRLFRTVRPGTGQGKSFQFMFEVPIIYSIGKRRCECEKKMRPYSVGAIWKGTQQADVLSN